MRRKFRMILLVLVSILSAHNLKADFRPRQRPVKIDSLSQLNKYDFIALVKIAGDKDLENKIANNFQTVDLLPVKIIELFKGEKFVRYLEHFANSSCDYGISKGEEWILFGKISPGKISIESSCENIRYKYNNGVRDWRNQTGFYELNQLRKLYHHSTENYNGIRKEFYPNGQVEFTANYANGKLNGERTIWYPNGTLLGKQNYINDLLNGKLQWFYPSGQIHEEEYYLEGKRCNVSRNYWDSTLIQGIKSEFFKQYYKDSNEKDSLDLVRSRVQLRSEIVYNSKGQIIVKKQYSIYGKLQNEEFSDPDRNFSTVVFYHHNGALSSIGYKLNRKNYGHYQAYDENGVLKEGWDYDEKGEKIK